jgi:hypothetical protein
METSFLNCRGDRTRERKRERVEPCSSGRRIDEGSGRDGMRKEEKKKNKTGWDGDKSVFYRTTIY